VPQDSTLEAGLITLRNHEIFEADESNMFSQQTSPPDFFTSAAANPNKRCLKNQTNCFVLSAAMQSDSEDENGADGIYRRAV